MAKDGSGAKRAVAVAVIPARRAAGTIAGVVRGALRHCDRVVVGDDASDDGTGEAARGAGARVIVMPRHRGKGEVLRRLLAEAWSLGATVAVALDADGQHDPEDIPRFLAAHARDPGALLVGDRLAGGDRIPRARLAAQRLATTFLRHAAGCPLADTQCGFRLVPRAVGERVAARAPGFAMETEFLIAALAHAVPVLPVPISAKYPEGQTSQFRPIADFFSIASVVVAGGLIRAWAEAAGSRKAPLTAARWAGCGPIRWTALALAPAVVPLTLATAACAPERFPIFGRTRAGVAAFARDCALAIGSLARALPSHEGTD